MHKDALAIVDLRGGLLRQGAQKFVRIRYAFCDFRGIYSNLQTKNTSIKVTQSKNDIKNDV